MAILQQLPTAPGFHFCFCKFSSASRLKPIMLQYRVLQNIRSNGIRCSPFGSGDTYCTLPGLSSRNLQVSCTFTAGYPTMLSHKPRRNFLLLRSHTNGSHFAFSLQPPFKVALPNQATPLSRLSYRSLDSGIGISAPFYNDYGRRSLSRISRALVSKNDELGDRDGRRGGKNLFFSASKKHLEWEKPLACKNEVEGGGRKASKPKTSAHNDVDIVSSGGPPAVDSSKDGAKLEVSSPTLANNKKVPKGKVKKMQQSRNNKSKEIKFATATSDAAAPRRASKKASVLKDPSSSKNGRSTLSSESISEGKTPMEVSDSSVEGPHQSKTMKMKRKGKPAKEASVPLKSGEILEDSTGSELLQKQSTTVKSKQLQMTKRQLYPPTGKSLLIVESVSKAKVIQGYLGDMFEVLPSYGHVRDLAARSGSVRPDDDFSMVWEVPSAAWTHLKSIKVALSGIDNLILASDPDREGEAIAWHIVEMLQQQNALCEDIHVARVVFNEITESAVKSALQTPRDIDVNLVHAYLARRALDYLIGFNISPLLWRKLPGCQSAGRVQSAALSLICDRETEIDEFKPQEYWTVQVEFLKEEDKNKLSCPSHLTHFNSKLLKQLSVTSQAEVNIIEKMIHFSKFKVVGSTNKKIRKNPPAPYVTSTLQQDAANKLHFSTMHTMKLAQKLYEGVKLSADKSAGLITYMRTDGLHISSDSAKDIRSLVVERYGKSFASGTDRKFFKKVKNAQEAHEAIRPTDIRRLPSMLAGLLDADSLKLYTLIWSRTVACQMETGIIEQIQIDIGNACQSVLFRSSCSSVSFLGYKAVEKDEETAAIRNNEDEGNEHNELFDVLNNLKDGDPMDLGKVELKQHYTSPPSRYSEGALVKKMEELGIGRPSTYASTIKVLRDRNYVTAKSRVLHPEFRGRMVSAFLSHHFSEVTDYSFTADTETELDNVSAGLTEWKGLLRDYWTRFSNYCTRASTVHIRQVEKMLEKTFENFLFASLPDKNRKCPSCDEGTLTFQLSRFGSGYFIGCDQHPKCKYISKTLYGGDEEDVATEENRAVEPPTVLGLKPGSTEKVLLKNGPYGHYVQLGEDRKGHSPKRASLPKTKDISSVTLEDALHLLSYPIKLGNHPIDGQPVLLRLAKDGLSIKHTNTNSPVPKNQKESEITMEIALKILDSKAAKHTGRPKKSKLKVEEAIVAM